MTWRERARKIQKGPPGELTKQTKEPFVSSVSTQEGTFQSFRSYAACGECRHFQQRPGEQPDGYCRRLRVEAWGAVPFRCHDFEPANAAARGLEARLAVVRCRLAENAELRTAWDVATAPLKPTSGEPVSVVLAVRTSGGVVCGELQIPRMQFDSAHFLATMEQTYLPTMEAA